MKRCDTCRLSELCAFSQFEAETTIEAAEGDDGSEEALCLDEGMLVDELGHTEEEADVILQCLFNRTFNDCAEDSPLINFGTGPVSNS